MMRYAFSALLLVCAVLATGAGPATAAATATQLPRFASLKADEVHVRKGPGEEYDILWTYRSLGLPVEVTAEHEHWRRIRDSEGSEGWVYVRLLSALRAALVTPWEKGGQTSVLRASPETDGRAVAKLESGVKTFVHECDGSWCRVSVSQLSGWIEQSRLWGVYPKESFK
jgi:SH3-like domain-containing protein